MTRKGAAMVIESLSLRIFDIEEHEARLAKEKATHRARIAELEQVRDPVEATRIISIGDAT